METSKARKGNLKDGKRRKNGKVEEGCGKGGGKSGAGCLQNLEKPSIIEEDIIDGYAFLSFENYEDIEKAKELAKIEKEKSEICVQLQGRSQEGGGAVSGKSEVVDATKASNGKQTKRPKLNAKLKGKKAVHERPRGRKKQVSETCKSKNIGSIERGGEGNNNESCSVHVATEDSSESRPHNARAKGKAKKKKASGQKKAGGKEEKKDEAGNALLKVSDGCMDLFTNQRKDSNSELSDEGTLSGKHGKEASPKNGADSKGNGSGSAPSAISLNGEHLKRKAESPFPSEATAKLVSFKKVAVSRFQGSKSPNGYNGRSSPGKSSSSTLEGFKPAVPLAGTAAIAANSKTALEKTGCISKSGSQTLFTPYATTAITKINKTLGRSVVAGVAEVECHQLMLEPESPKSQSDLPLCSESSNVSQLIHGPDKDRISPLSNVATATAKDLSSAKPILSKFQKEDVFTSAKVDNIDNTNQNHKSVGGLERKRSPPVQESKEIHDNPCSEPEPFKGTYKPNKTTFGSIARLLDAPKSIESVESFHVGNGESKHESKASSDSGSSTNSFSNISSSSSTSRAFPSQKNVECDSKSYISGISRSYSPRGHSPSRERDSYSSNVSSLSRASITPLSSSQVGRNFSPLPSSSTSSVLGQKNVSWLGSEMNNERSQPPPTSQDAPGFPLYPPDPAISGYNYNHLMPSSILPNWSPEEVVNQSIFPVPSSSMNLRTELERQHMMAGNSGRFLQTMLRPAGQAPGHHFAPPGLKSFDAANLYVNPMGAYSGLGNLRRVNVSQHPLGPPSTTGHPMPIYTPEKQHKKGKWNAKHVKIAWDIYHDQQRKGTSSNNSLNPSRTATPTSGGTKLMNHMNLSGLGTNDNLCGTPASSSAPSPNVNGAEHYRSICLLRNSLTPTETNGHSLPTSLLPPLFNPSFARSPNNLGMIGAFNNSLMNRDYVNAPPLDELSRTPKLSTLNGIGNPSPLVLNNEYKSPSSDGKRKDKTKGNSSEKRLSNGLELEKRDASGALHASLLDRSSSIAGGRGKLELEEMPSTTKTAALNMDLKSQRLKEENCLSVLNEKPPMLSYPPPPPKYYLNTSGTVWNGHNSMLNPRITEAGLFHGTDRPIGYSGVTDHSRQSLGVYPTPPTFGALSRLNAAVLAHQRSQPIPSTNLGSQDEASSYMNPPATALKEAHSLYR